MTLFLASARRSTRRGPRAPSLGSSGPSRPVLRCRIARWAALGASTLLLGCPLPLSENGRLKLTDHGVFALPDVGAYAWDGSQPVVAGTEICPVVRCAADCPENPEDDDTFEVSTCYDAQVGGAGEALDEGCLRFDGEGELTWAFSPRSDPPSCTAAQAGWEVQEDRFVFATREPDGLSARIDRSLERIARQFLSEPEPTFFPVDPAAVPDDLYPAANEPIRFLADTWLRLTAGLVDEVGHGVGYALSQATLELTVADPGTGAVALEHQGDGAAPSPTRIVRLGEGAEVRAELWLLGRRFETERLLGVAPDDVVALELFAFRQEDRSPNPAGFRAVGRTADGQAVLGLPVQWEVLEEAYGVHSLMSVSGRWPLEEGPPVGEEGEWVYLVDECVPPDNRAGGRVVSVRATWGPLSAELAVPWTGPENASAEGFSPDEACRGPGRPPPDEEDPEPDNCCVGDALPDCSCRGSADASGALAGLAALALGAARACRRRRARPGRTLTHKARCL